MYDILQLNDMLVPELRELAESLGVDGFKKLNKQELVYTILDHQALAGEKKKSGSNGSGSADLPDEVPVSSDNMRVDKRQPGAVLKRGRKPNPKEVESAPEEDVEEAAVEVPEVKVEKTINTPAERPQPHQRPQHRDRSPQAPRENRNPQEAREPREPRAPQQHREPRGPHEPREPRTPHEPREPRAPQVKGNPVLHKNQGLCNLRKVGHKLHHFRITEISRNGMSGIFNAKREIVLM